MSAEVPPTSSVMTLSMPTARPTAMPPMIARDRARHQELRRTADGAVDGQRAAVGRHQLEVGAGRDAANPMHAPQVAAVLGPM